MSEEIEDEQRAHLSTREGTELVRSEVTAVSEAELVAQNAGAGRAAALVRAVYPGLRRFRTAMLRLPDFDIRNLDNLPVYGQALAQAALDVRAESVEPRPVALVERALRATRRDWKAQFRRLETKGLLSTGSLSALRGGDSWNGLVHDIRLLIVTIEKHPVLLEKTAITGEEIRTAAGQAEWLAEQPTAKQKRRAAPSVLLVHKRKAFSLLYRAYDEVRRAMAFLRWREGDAHLFAPALTGAHIGRAAKLGG